MHLNFLVASASVGVALGLVLLRRPPFISDGFLSHYTSAIMGFRDLKSPAGLQLLNTYLVDKIYIEGYVPSQADIAVFEAVGIPPPNPAELCHVLRWYNNIKSYEKQKASLPGVKKALGKYGPADVEDTTGAGGDSKDDDDIDLFGSDEEAVPRSVSC